MYDDIIINNNNSTCVTGGGVVHRNCCPSHAHNTHTLSLAVSVGIATRRFSAREENKFADIHNDEFALNGHCRLLRVGVCGCDRCC